MKRTIGKIFLIVSIACVALAFVALFLPAARIQYIIETLDGRKVIDSVQIATGSATPLIAFMLGLSYQLTFNPGSDYPMLPKVVDNCQEKFRQTIPAMIQFGVLIVLAIFALVILILILSNKFSGKRKVVLSIFFWFFLVVTIFGGYIQNALVNVHAGDKINEAVKDLLDDDKYLYVHLDGYGLASIVLMLSGAGALVTSIIGSILNRDEKKVKLAKDKK